MTAAVARASLWLVLACVGTEGTHVRASPPPARGHAPATCDALGHAGTRYGSMQRSTDRHANTHRKTRRHRLEGDAVAPGERAHARLERTGHSARGQNWKWTGMGRGTREPCLLSSCGTLGGTLGPSGRVRLRAGCVPVLRAWAADRAACIGHRVWGHAVCARIPLAASCLSSMFRCCVARKQPQPPTRV